MSRIAKSLKVANDTLEIEMVRADPSAKGDGSVGIQYGAYGDDGLTASTGTVVLEATINEVEWYALKITKNDDTAVDNLAAVGLGSGKIRGYIKARARLSVAGGAHGVKVWLNYLTS